MGTGDLLIKYEEQGFKDFDGYICAECVGDDYIKEWINNNYEIETECNYCGKIHKCISMNTFAKKLTQIVDHYYDDTNNYGKAVYDGEMCPIYYQSDIMEIISDNLNIDYNSPIIKDLINHNFADKRYCPSNPFSMKPYDFEKYCWMSFCNNIKKSEKFVNEQKQKYYDLVDTIVSGFIDYNMITYINTGEKLYRSRSFGDEFSVTFEKDKLVSPPKEKAGANRMSKSGESVFYCAPERNVSLREVENPEEPYYVCAEFNVTRKFKCLDLTKLSYKDCPSWFDLDKEEDARKYYFYNYLCAMLTKPFTENVEQEYRPIQEFANFCKQQFEGIIYYSAKVRTEKCYVLFITHEECLENPQYPFTQPSVDMYNTQKYKLKNSEFVLI